MLLVEACIESGDVELAIKTLDESLLIIQDSGGHFFEAEHYRLKGKLAHSKLTNQTQKALQTEAERNYISAIEVSQRQNAKLLELRATVNLGDLWRAMGKKSEALKMLQEVYNWFDEGFDLPDLIDAKKLLGMLKK